MLPSSNLFTASISQSFNWLVVKLNDQLKWFVSYKAVQGSMSSNFGKRQMAKGAKLQVVQLFANFTHFKHENGTNFLQKSMVALFFKNKQIICLWRIKVTNKNVDEIDP